LLWAALLFYAATSANRRRSFFYWYCLVLSEATPVAFDCTAKARRNTKAELKAYCRLDFRIESIVVSLSGDWHILHKQSGSNGIDERRANDI
jgi:hypothetical protein